MKMPSFVIERLRQKKRPGGKTLPRTRSRSSLGAGLNKLDVPHFRFLRPQTLCRLDHARDRRTGSVHTTAGAAWASDNVMKAVYRNVIDLETDPAKQEDQRAF